MSDETNTLRIWSHVRQVAPLSNDPAGDAWFTVNLTPVFVTDTSVGATVVDPALAKKYLRPWTWSWTTLRLALVAGGVVQKTLDIPATQVLREPPDTVSTMFDDEFATATATFESSSFTEGPTNPRSTTSLSDDDTTRNWKLYLFHASTYAGDIPMQAGLVAWFHISYAQLAGADEIIVAPIFDGAPFAAAIAPSIPAAGCVTLTAPGANCPMTRLNPDLTAYSGSGTWVTLWQYGTPTGTDLKAQWIQPYTKLRIPATASWSWPTDSENFISEASFWVSPNTGQGNDWHEQLEGRLSGLFDLPLRLLEWVDQWVLTAPQNAPPAIDPAFGTALIATMRDLMRTAGNTSNTPTVNRPDGGTLGQDIARLLAPGISNLTIRQQLITAVQTYYVQFDSYSQWIARITNALAASGRFSAADLKAGWENPPTPSTDITPLLPWLKLVHKARTWLFDPTNLAMFIIQDWTQALAGIATLAQILENNLDALTAYLTQIDLLGVLRQGFMGIAWSKQTNDWYAPANVAQSMSAALINVYRDRLQLPQATSWGYAQLLPAAPQITQAQRTAIEASLQAYITKWSTSPTGPTPTSPTAGEVLTPDYSQGNHGINIQFSSFSTDASANPADEQFFATFRGVGVMMRPAGTNAATNQPWTWSVLNLGQYSMRNEVDAALQVPPALDLTRVAVAPTQINSRNGLRQITCTYRNQPISSRSPAAALSQVRTMQGASGNQQAYETYKRGPYELWNPYRGTSPYRLPQLVFGTSYQIAAFAVGLAGELPKEICDPNKPWQVSAVPSAWTPPAPSAAIPYLRTVPIGPVRVQGTQLPRQSNEPITKLTLPVMPDNVYPITRNLPGVDPKDTVLLLCDLSKTASWNSIGTSSAEFYVRPPSIDPQLFITCPFPAPPTLADRAEILALIAQNTDIRNGGDSATAPDLTLDDPMVSGFTVKLSQLYPNAVEGVPTPFNIRRPAGTLMNAYQSQAVHVQIKVDDSVVNPTPTVPTTPANPYEIDVTVPGGTVYKLEIAPAATASMGLIDPGAQKIATRTFYIEVAMPLQAPDLNAAANELNQAITSANSRNIDISVDITKLTTLRPQIHHVELMVQRWRWQGRPLARVDADENTLFTFPYDLIAASGDADKTLLPLDGIYFGERNTSDQLVITGQVEGFLPDATVQSIYRYDLSSSPQALYYRFALRAFTRYEGFFSGGTSVESRFLGVASGQAAPPQGEQWRRVLPLCARTVKAPKPSVRMVIPLTQTGAGAETPGLLAVLDDIWYDWAGLAEQLDVQVVQAAAYQGNLLEAGPDPVVTNVNYDPTNNGPSPQIIEQTLTAAGPIGFTFDTGAVAAPLFGMTSFLIPAPRLSSGDVPVDLSWWFLQLKFRCSLNPTGTANYDVNLNSDWTAPLQVQLLPASNLWTVTAGGLTVRVDVSMLSIQFAQPPAAVAVVNDFGIPVVVNPEPFDTSAAVTNRFEVWALLTVQLTDAFGNGTQEAFVDMVPFAALANFVTPVGKSAPTALRLIEVQAMNGLSPIRTTWSQLADDLFPDNQTPGVDPAMSRARIVRVSPPITVAQ